MSVCPRHSHKIVSRNMPPHSAFMRAVSHVDYPTTVDRFSQPLLCCVVSSRLSPREDYAHTLTINYSGNTNKPTHKCLHPLGAPCLCISISNRQ